jgi:hypothetical protein
LNLDYPFNNRYAVVLFTALKPDPSSALLVVLLVCFLLCSLQKYQSQ